MAIRLSLDLTGATCGELLRFADTVRAAGVAPSQPVEREADRIEVAVGGGDPGPPESYGTESYGPESYGPPFGPMPMNRPGGRPGHTGPGGRPSFSGPAGPPRPARPGGPVPPGAPIQPGWPGQPPHHVTSHYAGSPPTQGAHISVRRDGITLETDVSTETVERWKVALSEALEAGGLSEATRGPLLELRELLSVDRGFRAS